MAHPIFPSQLTEAVATILDVPEPTVRQVDRHLVTAGIRQAHGRGRSAKTVTPVDAANLLIAIAAAPISGSAIIESASNYEKFASLPAVGQLPPTLATWPATIKSKHLGRLQCGHTLRDGIAALIWAAPAGECPRVKFAPSEPEERSLEALTFDPEDSSTWGPPPVPFDIAVTLG